MAQKGQPGPRRAQVKTYRQEGTTGYRHRAIAEHALGHPIPPNAVVHHVDGDIGSMSPRLVICEDRAYHKLLHYRASLVGLGINPNTHRRCGSCGLAVPPSGFNRRRLLHGLGFLSTCRSCQQRKFAAWAAKSLGVVISDPVQ